ncbi:hypothetical protein AAEU28_09055 [Pseudoalteromonas sp. SS15]|uniref:hypothetical protein n=1 Tax=Pseudoalteromonas sp. SS15 TaxID=3139393 RepID=UPI003BAB2FAB
MSNITLNRLPLLFLLSLVATYAWFYSSSSFLNEYGSYKPEWPLLLDTFITLPLICYVCLADKKQATIKAITYCALIILFGAYFIPTQQKFIWHYLEQARYLVLALVLFIELVVVASVIAAIKTNLNTHADPDESLITPLKRWLTSAPVLNLMQFDMRMWVFCLFAHKIKGENYIGEQHFWYANKDDAKGNALGFIFLMALEIPIAHLVLHFVWSPLAANVISLLSIFGLVLFIGEYRAMSRRPISLTQTHLIVRYGIYNPLHIALDNIESVSPHHEFVPRSNEVNRYNFSGVPNIEIKLRSPIGGKSKIYLGVDSPSMLLNSLNKASDKTTN